MRRWIKLVAGLYPRSWREEFGDEFGALLDDVKPRWRVFGNVLGGAITMQITDGTDWWKPVVAMAIVGVIIAAGMSFTVAPHYVSSAVVSVTPQSDPLRPTSPQVLRQRAAERAAEMETEILSRSELSTIINDPKLLLYTHELRRMPLEDVIAKMRHDIVIQARPSAGGDLAPVVFSISFSYPDQVKAQATVRVLADKFAEVNAAQNRVRELAYRGFWGDMSALNLAKTAPPPPVGESVGLADLTNLPTESKGPRRLVYMAWGLGVGLLLGLFAAAAMRRPRVVSQLSGFAVAGFVLAAALSFLIPNRYTSTAVMEITPAVITEDPLAPLPAAPSPAEFLSQIEPEVLSFQSLSKIIQDRRINLYSEERAEKPMEEVVRNMLANDLRIEALGPPSGTKGAVPAFSISFSYSDRFKAQQAVQMLMNRFDDAYLTKQWSNAEQRGFAARRITQRKAGENLDVLDTASLPGSPVKPNRLVIAAMGLVIGLLLGALSLAVRRSPTPTLQTA